MSGTSGTATSPFGYAASYLDPSSGLNYMRARWYDAGTGQWMSLDPMVMDTQSPFAYVNNDPVNELDPSGLGAPQAPQLSPAEEEAVANKDAGLPYVQKDYKSAQNKLRTGGKYRGEINVQKRQSNFSVIVPPYSPIIMTPSQEGALVAVTLATGVSLAVVAAIALVILAF